MDPQCSEETASIQQHWKVQSSNTSQPLELLFVVYFKLAVTQISLPIAVNLASAIPYVFNSQKVFQGMNMTLGNDIQYKKWKT